MNNPPDGIVTFLFTDIEGSTKLAQQFPDTLPKALLRHHEILHKTIEEYNGYVFEIIGDAFCAAFNSPLDAINSACEIQKNLKDEAWGEAVIKIRIGLNTGEAKFNGKGYTGYMALSRTARVMSVAHGEQILISQLTYAHTHDLNTKEISFIDMGERRLKDLVRSEHIYQLAADYLRRDFPPLKTIDSQPNNLPIQVTSFIGREKEIKDVKELLSKTRMLTLLGSGGTGKTRISIQIGAEMIDEFTGGVFFIELSTINDPTLVTQEIASVFNLHESGNRKITEILLEYLKDKNLLLIIDNCEHLIGECAKVIDLLTRKCEYIKILATSRESLRISGETIYRIPSLKVPEIKTKYTLESISEFESVRLFMDRASTAKQDFTITETNATFIAQICNNLDGIPFAIELAAARVRSLTVDKIAERLNDRFRLLTGGSRTALPKQQTLHAMIDWSYNLLNEQEKALLRRMSVFSGGSTLESGEEVCSGNEIEDFEILDLMSSLVDKSLISFDESNSRYGQLETVRQYGIVKLKENTEDREYKIKHLEHYCKLAEEAEPMLIGQEQVKWLNKIESEHNNLRAAIGWCIENNELTEKGLRLVTAISQFWQIRGYFSEGKRFINNLINIGEIEDKLKGKALSVAGKICVNLGDYKEADINFNEALKIFQNIDDNKSIADSFNNLASVAYFLGKFDEAQIQLEKAKVIFENIGNKRNIADSLNYLGLIASCLGDIAKARSNYKDSIKLYNEIGYKVGAANLQINLGKLAGSQGEYSEAKKCFEDSLKIYHEIGFKLGIAQSLNNLGAVAIDQKAYAEAIIILKEAIVVHRELEDKHGLSNSFGNLGWAEFHNEQFSESQEHFENALTIYLELGDKAGILQCLEGIGNLNLVNGHNTIAVKLYGVSNILRETIGNPVHPNEKERYELTITELRSKLGDEEFEKAWDEGRSLTLEEAVELALG